MNGSSKLKSTSLGREFQTLMTRSLKKLQIMLARPPISFPAFVREASASFVTFIRIGLHSLFLLYILAVFSCDTPTEITTRFGDSFRLRRHTGTAGAYIQYQELRLINHSFIHYTLAKYQ